MPETQHDCKGISNPAKLLRGYIEATGISDARILSERLGIPLRTIQRLKLEVASAVDDASAKHAIYGASDAPKTPNTPYMAPPKTPDMAFSAPEPSRAHATKESPTEINYSSNQLASLPEDDISQVMITDIVSWVHGFDRSNAEQWLLSTTKAYGSDITRQSYHKLKTDIVTGSVIARKLQAWCAIAKRMKSDPPKPAADVIPFKTSPELQQTAAIFAKIKAQGVYNAAG